MTIGTCTSCGPEMSHSYASAERPSAERAALESPSLQERAERGFLGALAAFRPDPNRTLDILA